jgi:hypothetical protein
VDKGDAPVKAEVQVLRIGDVALVGIPGEPFADLGLQIKSLSAASEPRGESGSPNTSAVSLCLGYANDYLGYIAPASEWNRGGYEVGLGMWSIVGPEAFETLLSKSRELVARLF